MAVMMARKKGSGSAQRGARVVKRDFARDEIVEEVVENLRPWKNHKSRDSVTTVVNEQLSVLAKLAPLLQELYNRGLNRGHAKKLDKALGNVEKLIKSAPAMLALSLFDPLPQDPWPIQPVEEIVSAHQVRAGGFFAELKRLRDVCARKVWTHPNYDRAKHLSARWAYGLMEELSDGRITGTADKPLRNIAGLLYEAVSGQPNADLKRACDEILRDKVRLKSGTNPPQ
jgi:hypothetical protein